MPRPNGKIDKKITYSLSRRVATTEKEIAELKTDVSYIREQIDALVRSVDRIIGARQTNWNVLATWAAVIIAVVAYHGNLVLEPIKTDSTELRGRIEKLEEKLESRYLSEHAELIYLRERIAQLEGMKLCREKLPTEKPNN